MSKTRKLLSVAIAVAMLLSVLAVGVFAGIGYSDDTDTTHTQEWALSTPVDNGDGTYSVDVSLTTTYATGAIEFMIENTDTAVAALSDAVLGDAVYFDADITFSATTGKVMIVPVTAGKTTVAGEAIDGVIATLVFDYAGDGTATINIAEDAKSTTNVGGTLIAVYASNLVNGSVKVGQAATFVDNSQVIGGAAGEAPYLAVIDGTNGVIDYDRIDLYEEGDGLLTGYIYGVEPENSECIEDIFEVVGDGYMSIVANEGGSECATGTIVEVYDNDDNLVETYALIIFGDIDGDGEISALDAGDAELHEAWAYGEDLRIMNPLYLFAGDVDGDGEVSALDAGTMELHEAWAYGDDLRFYQSEIIDLL